MTKAVRRSSQDHAYICCLHWQRPKRTWYAGASEQHYLQCKQAILRRLSQHSSSTNADKYRLHACHVGNY